MPRDLLKRTLRRLLSPLIREIVREEIAASAERIPANLSKIFSAALLKTIREELARVDGVMRAAK